MLALSQHISQMLSCQHIYLMYTISAMIIIIIISKHFGSFDFAQFIWFHFCCWRCCLNKLFIDLLNTKIFLQVSKIVMWASFSAPHACTLFLNSNNESTKDWVQTFLDEYMSCVHVCGNETFNLTYEEVQLKCENHFLSYV